MGIHRLKAAASAADEDEDEKMTQLISSLAPPCMVITTADKMQLFGNKFIDIFI